MGAGRGPGGGLSSQPSANSEFFAASPWRRVPPWPPTPAGTPAERRCSPPPEFHHPGGSGRSAGAGRKRALGVWDLAATLIPSERGVPCWQKGDLPTPVRAAVRIGGPAPGLARAQASPDPPHPGFPPPPRPLISFQASEIFSFRYFLLAYGLPPWKRRGDMGSVFLVRGIPGTSKGFHHMVKPLGQCLLKKECLAQGSSCFWQKSVQVKASWLTLSRCRARQAVGWSKGPLSPFPSPRPSPASAQWSGDSTSRELSFSKDSTAFSVLFSPVPPSPPKYT